IGERLADSLTTSFREGEGEAVVVVANPGGADRAPADAVTAGTDAADAADAADATAAAAGRGTTAQIPPRPRTPTLIRFSERFRCPDHPAVKFLEPTPRLFSFNNP